MGRRILGWSLISAPFVGIFVGHAWEHGVVSALGVFAGVILVVGVTVLGVRLTDG